VSTTRLSRHALIVATASYSDGRLAQLRSPAADAQALAGVLGDPDKGDFDVQLSIDEAHADLTRRIAVFFRDRLPNDLLLLHLSCHGVKDETGELYLAAADTDLDLLSATGISAAWLNERIDRTRSRRTVLLLDCCFSGSFPAGMRHRGGNDMDAPRQLQGRGRAIITASNAMEYAYEGDELTGEGQPSVFTEAVVEGLRTGKADLDMDHLVSIDDLYHYVYDRVRERAPNQTPSIKSDVEGVLYLARSSYRSTVEPAKLDPELMARTADHQAEIREGAVQELVRMLDATDPAVALAARELLLMMAGDTSRRVSTQAHTALEDEPRVAPPGQAPRPPRPRRPLAIGAGLAALAAVVIVLIVALSGGSSSSTSSSSSSASGTTNAVNTADKIPAGNLTANPSFEQDTSKWDVFKSKLARVRASDAPAGRYVVRIEAKDRSGEWGIDDLPDTVHDSVAGRHYTATAWVKGTDATDGKQLCLTVRERAQSGGDRIDQEGAGNLLSADRYEELRVPYLAHGNGHRVDVHVTTNIAGATPGDAFLADAISLTPSNLGRIGTGC
jgi:Caspase domain